MSLLLNKRIENEDLSGVFAVIETLKTMSGNEQLNFLKMHKNIPHLKEMLYYTYCPDLQYKIKEDKYNKINAPIEDAESGSLSWKRYKQYLDKFAGQKGVKDKDIEELIYNIYMCSIFKEILFKDLRLGMDIKSFNKVWDDFYIRPSLMLAEEFSGELFENAMFSRKLDGRRGYYLDGKFYSRNHKEYKTANIQHILDDIKKINPHNKDVFDGEFVYIDEDGKEDFSKSGIVTRDSYTSESKNIKFAIFYILDKSDFIEEAKSVDNFRQIYEFSCDLLEVEHMHKNGLIKTPYNSLLLVAQFEKSSFDHLLYISKKMGWEGLMMLDGDQKYQHKRTKYLQKIKEMKDAEFKIIGMTNGKGRFSETLGYITIELSTGEKVDVGSGFTDEQRNDLWNKNDLLNGDYYATVQYFEESHDKNGNKSLRFPVFRGLRNCIGEDI